MRQHRERRVGGSPPRRDRVRALSKSLYRVLQLTAARANLRRIDVPSCSNYSVIEVAMTKKYFEQNAF